MGRTMNLTTQCTQEAIKPTNFILTRFKVNAGAIYSQRSTKLSNFSLAAKRCPKTKEKKSDARTRVSSVGQLDARSVLHAAADDNTTTSSSTSPLLLVVVPIILTVPLFSIA
ncbi:hypothetical protein TorRG33x02_006430 [Trema orientale]|uniref:Uncharacterized protein n=1 Tax=Trema orientale TaxID=63057 RepID=A0A2P5G051_TREOI|nr:hypothetical protein TorRG33x02_006430 [Trema orientale]